MKGYKNMKQITSKQSFEKMETSVAKSENVLVKT